jgi:hypothetical protein
MKYLFFVSFYLIVFSSFSSISIGSDSLIKDKKLKFYFLWGYNKDFYAKSTIHLKNNGNPNQFNEYGIYDFKIYDAEAHDRPDFDQLKDIINITIPQFSTRLGVFFGKNKNHGIELNYDHTKYVVKNFQKVRVAGTAFGNSFDKDTILDPRYIHFEHTDGANFAMVNYIHTWSLFNKNQTKNKLLIIGKAGGGFVYPRTDVTLFGNRVNNDWHVSGYCAGIESGLRAELWKHLVLELTGKGVYANYNRCIIQGKNNGQASHEMLAAELIFCFGYSF